MKKKIFTLTGLFIGLAFWFADSAIHYFIYNELEFEFIPEDVDELWMRLVIVLLIFFLGIFADSYSKKLVIEEKQSEALDIYNSMLGATQHILNNLLNQTQLIKVEAMKSKDFNKEVIKSYDTAFNDALELIKKLSSVEDISANNIDMSVYPRTKDELSNEATPSNIERSTVS